MASAGEALVGVAIAALAAAVWNANQKFISPKPRGKWNDQFGGWAGPASLAEDTKVERAEKMVREAVGNNIGLTAVPLRVFGQGSSINNTNVRQASDVDLVVLSTQNIWSIPAPGEALATTSKPANTSLADAYVGFHDQVYRALVAKFGTSSVRADRKCLKIAETKTSRVACDVVPCFRLRKYLPRSQWNNGPPTYWEGVLFVDRDGKEIHSFPELHLELGRQKNTRTGYRYKQAVRVLKKFNAIYKEQRSLLSWVDLPSSFYVEALVFNVPDSVLSRGDLFDGVVGALNWLESTLADPERCNRLVAPNSIECLFSHWTTGSIFDAFNEPAEAEVCRSFVTLVRDAITEVA